MAPPSSRATSSTVSVGNSSTYSYNSSTSYSSGATVWSASSTSSAKTLRNQPYGGNAYGSHDSINGYPTGPSGYPYDHDGFTDDEEYEDYPQTAANGDPSSGRGTPINTSRKLNSLSMPAEQREPVYDQRSRAYTENADGHTMQQWRNHMPPPPPPQLSAHSPGGMQRPITPRTQSDLSFSAGGQPQRPPLRSQFSSSQLRPRYEGGGGGGGEYRNPRAPTPTHSAGAYPQPPTSQPPFNSQPLPVSRSRSASQPSAYNPPKGAPPPLPTNAVNVAHSNWTRDRDRVGNKRGSGSSQSTGDSSEYSPNSSSPITPFGSSESSLGGVGVHANVNGHHKNNSGVVGGHGEAKSPPVKVKVHFHEDIFVIQVPRLTEYDDLVEKVGKKIRLCGRGRDDGPLRVKYRDEDGDMVSLGSTEDVQIAFEAYRPGGQVTLFVT